MSRIGKQPIAIPPKVKVEVKGQKVLVEGPKGKLDWELPKRTSLKVSDGKIVVSRDGDDAQAKALHGLSRALAEVGLHRVGGVAEQRHRPARPRGERAQAQDAVDEHPRRRGGGELSGTLADYAAARRPRARMLQQESSRFARLALSTHTGPRDVMMRLTPEAVRRRAMERLLRRHAPRHSVPAG